MVMLSADEYAISSASVAPASFHEGHHTCRAGVSTFDLEGRCNHHEAVLPYLGQIGDELNHRNAFLEQSEVVCDPHLAWVELDPPPERLFRKDVHRHGGGVFFCPQFAHARLQVKQVPSNLSPFP